MSAPPTKPAPKAASRSPPRAAPAKAPAPAAAGTPPRTRSPVARPSAAAAAGTGTNFVDAESIMMARYNPEEAAVWAAREKTFFATPAEAAPWHGYLLKDECATLPAPYCVTISDDLARPDYTKIKSAEFIDHPEVLERKAEIFIEMIRAARHPMVYAGAGISTSSGIRDYASNATGSVVQPAKARLTMAFIESLKPTPAHRVITALEKQGLVEHWLQQNHDGLAQKAGFPAEKVNEIHGAWLDSKRNPIIKMSGSLRSDLFQWCCEWEERADFVFALGTSFSGLNADRVAASCADRHMRRGQGVGSAVLAIQQTPMDDRAALRIFARCDDFMLVVARKMRLPIDMRVHPYRNMLDTPSGRQRARDAQVDVPDKE